MQSKLILYSTEGCHLCELAQSIVKKAEFTEFTLVDIAFDDELFIRYGTSIPVLKRSDNNNELYWPFNHEDFMEFMR